MDNCACIDNLINGVLKFIQKCLSNRNENSINIHKMNSFSNNNDNDHNNCIFQNDRKRKIEFESEAFSLVWLLSDFSLYSSNLWFHVDNYQILLEIMYFCALGDAICQKLLKLIIQKCYEEIKNSDKNTDKNTNSKSKLKVAKFLKNLFAAFVKFCGKEVDEMKKDDVNNKNNDKKKNTSHSETCETLLEKYKHSLVVLKICLPILLCVAGMFPVVSTTGPVSNCFLFDFLLFCQN